MIAKAGIQRVWRKRPMNTSGFPPARGMTGGVGRYASVQHAATQFLEGPLRGNDDLFLFRIGSRKNYLGQQ